jgi:hypothetical protein
MAVITKESQRSPTRTAGDFRLVRASGAVYVVAWVVGLLVAPSAPSQTDPDLKVQTFFVHHHTATLIQALLVHGVAAVALAGFVIGLAASPLTPRSGAARSILLLTGLAAAAVSLVQVGLEIAINRHVAGGGSASTTASLFHAVNIADTVKLILLGVMIVAATRAAEEVHSSRGWLRWLGYALLPILVVGGIAFVLHSAVLNAILDLSLLLLLLWVGAVALRAPRLAGVEVPAPGGPPGAGPDPTQPASVRRDGVSADRCG